MKLVKYDAACKAIAAARNVDEVKSIRDPSIAMKAYARQAKNHTMEADAVEIRMRATRRMDQMRQEQKKTVGLAKGGTPYKNKGKGKNSTGVSNTPVEKPTLADAGINKNLAKEGRKLGALSEREFEKAVTTARDAVSSVIKTALRNDDKKERRDERERELAVKITALPDKQYGVILADPPWRFTSYSAETGMDRAADNHYPTMDVAAIAALKVPAAADCVLFLWATVPMLPQALDVLRSWGFEYKSHFTWVKDKAGTGFWNKNKHELLLIGTRGSIPAPAPGEQYESAITAPRGAHSAKPFAFHEMIETMFPTLPRIELFAREAFAGWDSWGNEVQEAAE
jgi:N6-adenosine-specific RNA methylase IME4